MPFIVGIQQSALLDTLDEAEQLKSEMCIIDFAAKGAIKFPQLPNLAQASEIKAKLKPLHASFRRSITGNAPCFKCPDELLPLMNEIKSTIKNALDSMFENFYQYCITNTTEEAVTVFNPESFLMNSTKHDRPFFTLFLETQMFSDFKDRKVRELDDIKNAQRKAESNEN